MQLTYRTLVALTLVKLATAVYNRTYVHDDDSPIRYYDTSLGGNDHERVEYIMARIHPFHLRTNQRVDFPTWGPVNRYFLEAKADADERGHLVASRFSGPPEWYNLSPQNSEVNRNSGARSITTDWFNTECEVAQFLRQLGNYARYVIWEVRMLYTGLSNRPHHYELTVQFFENGHAALLPIQTSIHNRLLTEPSRWWICNANCTRHHHWYDDDDDDDSDEDDDDDRQAKRRRYSYDAEVKRRRRSARDLEPHQLLRKRRSVDTVSRKSRLNGFCVRENHQVASPGGDDLDP